MYGKKQVRQNGKERKRSLCGMGGKEEARSGVQRSDHEDGFKAGREREANASVKEI